MNPNAQRRAARPLLLALLVALLAGALVGCGDDGDQATTGTDGATRRPPS